MKVLVIGGTGVFGSRLAERLIANGHTVTLASRSRKTGEKTAATLGARWVQCDISVGVSAILRRDKPDMIVDAAGPFQAYGAEGYRIAEAAIDHKIHYLDLSDDAAFTAGIAALDTAAVAAGVTVLSGVSSVPALSSAIVADLAQGLRDVNTIDTAILPGNRAPRGRSVMAAILRQIGEPIRLWRGNAWSNVPGWSGQKLYSVSKTVRRHAAFISAPDLALFPQHFKARSVLFRAGLELPLFQQSLRVMGWLHTRKIMPRLDTLTPLIHWLANRFERFGSDIGGMVIRVDGRDTGGKGVSKEWRLLVKGGDGPYVPTLAAETLINQWKAAPPKVGARACLAEHSRETVEGALNTLDSDISLEQQAAAPLFEDYLGPRWATLPAPIQRAHDIWDMDCFTGKANITRGKGLIANFIAHVFRFPKAGRSIDVSITMQRIGRKEVWTRRFGAARLKSVLSLKGDGTICERFSLLSAQLDIHAKDGALHFPVKRAWLAFIPLPRWLTPTSIAKEYVEDERFHFDIALSAPGLGLICQYQGWLEPRQP